MLSLPLAKLSVAEDADPAKQKFTWKHEQHDLTFILDSYGARGSSQLLKVVQGTQVRQVIELELMIKEGEEMARSMRDRGVELKADQLPVSAIVRCPLLAIRWQLPNKKVRRAQLKFRSSEDFDAAYSQLYQLGLRMSSSIESQAQTQAPITSSERAISSSKANPVATATPYHSASGSLTCPPSKLLEFSNRPYTATNAPTALESQLQEVAHRRPMSAYTSRSNETDNGVSLSTLLTPPVYFARPTSATSDVLGRTMNASVFPSSEWPNPTMEEIPRGSEERPETAMLYRPDTAESLLPPRRELPFHRPSISPPSGRDSVRSSSRPLTGLMGPPPVPARVASLRPSSSPENIRQSELPPQSQPTFVGGVRPWMQAAQQSPSTPTEAYSAPMPAATSLDNETKTRQSQSSSPVSSPLSLNRPSSNMHTSLRPLSSLGSAAQNPFRTTSQNRPATPPTSDVTYPEAGTSQAAHSSALKPDNNLAAYAMQSEEGRRVALNEFIFRHLESDEFLTLVEDMETCWARVTLGRQ
ncbi:hypothetical protein N0V83_004672 [Neocucurbitaria cava]|uniref:Uncharacterized protein n=1 Tax=Neocucurbitaria cava TaxID=798079 RepID=A0A9W8YCE8_9PLEO|nr:hypothetical protein N0V83_004672 [Neocucurbitaria cava]